MTIVLLLLTLHFSLDFSLFVESQCQSFGSIKPFTGGKSVCSTVLSENYQVFVENTTCLENIEQSSTVSGFPSLWLPLSLACAQNVARYQCQSAYPSCINNSPVLPCSNVCTDIITSCNALDTAILTLSQFDLTKLNCSNDNNNNNDCSNLPLPVSLPLPQCAKYTGKVCEGIINYPYYLPPTLTQDFFEEKAASLSRLFAIAPRENDCQKKAAAFYCSQIFMRCDDTVVERLVPGGAGSGMKLPFPRYPCKQLCYDYNNSCQDLIKQNSSLIPDCDSHGNAPDAQRACNGSLINLGQDNFPMDITVFSNSSGIVLYTDCNPLPITDFSVTAAAFSDCPFPLVQPEDYSRVDTWVLGSCALPCPLFTSTKERNRRDDLIFTICKWFSSVLIAFMVLSYLVFPSKRKVYILRNFLAALFIENMGSMSGMFKIPAGDPTFLDLEVSKSSVTLRCLNNAMAHNEKISPLCGYQNFINGFGNNAITCWWMLLALDLWLRIVLDLRIVTTYPKVINLFYLYGYGAPLLFTTIGAAMGSISSVGGWGCTATDVNVQWIGMYGLLFANISIGCLLMLWTIGKILVVGLRSRARPQYLKLLFIEACFLASFINVLRVKFKLGEWIPKQTESATAWLYCLLTNMNDPNKFQTCGTSPSFNYDITDLMVQQATSGILGFILFFDLSLYALWKDFLKAPSWSKIQKGGADSDHMGTNSKGGKSLQHRSPHKSNKALGGAGSTGSTKAMELTAKEYSEAAPMPEQEALTDGNGCPSPSRGVEGFEERHQSQEDARAYAYPQQSGSGSHGRLVGEVPPTHVTDDSTTPGDADDSIYVT